tara:strand:+ start:8979 stop:9497 length:519 start_codon:yes stop_codon:yes gene_type:complete
MRSPTKTDLMQRSDDEKRAHQGRVGENIVANYYAEQKKTVITSYDTHDNEKDLLIEGWKVEVKTEVPYFSKDAFTFRVSQLQKCKNADLVYFVSVPAYGKHHFSFGKVYRIRSEKMKYSFYYKDFGPRGKPKMVMVPIRQEGMEYVFDLTEGHIAKLQEYSTSNFNKYTGEL